MYFCLDTHSYDRVLRSNTACSRNTAREHDIHDGTLTYGTARCSSMTFMQNGTRSSCDEHGLNVLITQCFLMPCRMISIPKLLLTGEVSDLNSNFSDLRLSRFHQILQ
jgi:hypothetical protein